MREPTLKTDNSPPPKKKEGGRSKKKYVSKKYEKCQISLINKEIQTKIRDPFYQLRNLKSSIIPSVDKIWGKVCKLVQPFWRGFVSVNQETQIIKSFEPTSLSQGVNAKEKLGKILLYTNTQAIYNTYAICHGYLYFLKSSSGNSYDHLVWEPWLSERIHVLKEHLISNFCEPGTILRNTLSCLTKRDRGDVLKAPYSKNTDNKSLKRNFHCSIYYLT